MNNYDKKKTKNKPTLFINQIDNFSIKIFRHLYYETTKQYV